MQYMVPNGGLIKLILPDQVFVETQPTVKIYKGYGTSALSIEVVNDPVAEKNEIHIKLREDLNRGANGQGQVYTIEWDGNRNPRTFMPTDLFAVWTYDGIV